MKHKEPNDRKLDLVSDRHGRAPAIGDVPFSGGRRAAPQGVAYQATLSQYPALNGLLMRNASGETSTSLSVGIFSPASMGASDASASPWT